MILSLELNNGATIEYTITDKTKSGIIYFKDVFGVSYKMNINTKSIWDYEINMWRHMKNFSSMIKEVKII